MRGAAIIRRHLFLSICASVVAGLLGVSLLFIWLVLPYIVRTQAEAYVSGRNGDRLTMDRLAIVPLFEPSLRIDNLRLTQADGSLLVAFKQLSIRLSPASLIRRALVIDEISLDGPQAAVTLLPKGQLNWDSLIGSPSGAVTAAPPTKTSGNYPLPGILIRKLSLSDGQIDLADRRTSAVQSVQIKPLAITLTDLSTLPADKQGAYALTAKSSLGAQVDWSGTVSLNPLSIAGAVRLNGLLLPKLAALLPLPPKLAAPQGTATLATRYTAGVIAGHTDFQLADLSMRLDGLRISGKQNPDSALALTHVLLDGGQFDLRRRQLAIQSIALTGGGISARRLADGRIDLLDLAPESAGPSAQAQPASSPGASWHYLIGRLALGQFAAEFHDDTLTPGADFAVQDITTEVKGVSENLDTPLPVHIALRARDGGSVAVDGKIVPEAPSADLRVRVDDLALSPIQPYLGSATILKLAGGTLSIAGQATYDKGSGKYSGGFSLQDFRLLEGEEGRPFLAWKSLSTDSLTASPAAIDIHDLRLDGLDTALTVAKDRTIDVTQIMRSPAHTPDARRAVAARAPEPAEAPAATAAPAIDIGRFHIRRGELDYTDLSLALPFATHVHDLNGTITNISTRPGAGPARIDLKGRVDEYGSASASGRFDLMAPTKLLDIDTAFDNIELSNLTPYLATFAGRRIESGTLTLDLRYKIDRGQMAGDNRIILDQLTLGGRVRSLEARDLPLDLAIAILKDGHGRIDLGIPISGSLADPQFSYGRIIWKAVSNLLTRIVTSPFRALGGLFGGNAASSNIAFAAGQSSVTPAARQTLTQLAASLNGRPNLILTLRGTWSEADRGAIREQQLRRAVADKLGLPPGADLSGITPDQADVKPALEALYADRYGQSGLSALKDGYRQANAGKLKESVTDQALSLVTGFLHKEPSLGAAEIAGMKGADFYALLYQRLRDAEAVADATLLDLARTRAEAAVATLRDAHLPPDRVTLQPSKRVDAGAHGVPLEMTLSPVTQPQSSQI